MPEALLQTKLFIPPLRPNLVPRPRLIERPTQGLQLGQKLTLISAPAGFGKTTLVTEWLSGLIAENVTTPVPAHLITPTPLHPYAHIHIAWLSLDEGDSDPARFLAYLIAALNRAEGPVLSQNEESALSAVEGEAEGMENTLGSGALSMLQSPQAPPAEDVLTSLINDISTIPGRIILVLDDYHSLVSSPVDEAIDFLLEHMPPQMHLVISTREDPNLPLARLRARGQLTELRATDLRFSSSEAAEFLNRVMGLDLSAEDIDALETRTEGWIAGLQLAALALQGLALQGQISMQGQRDAAGFIKSFKGSHYFVLDYLIEEVLEQQSKSIQNFLLQTAVLDRLTGSLCDALTGQDDGRQTLERLERSNLFIMPLDEERHWYRYHHLFSDLLRRRLRQQQPDRVPILHHRASEWYQQNDLADQAIEHALWAADLEQAAQLIEEYSDATWGRGEHKKLRGWLNGLPKELLLSRPHIAIMQARYLCNSGQLDAAERTLEVAEKAIDSNTQRAPKAGAQERSPSTHSDKVKLRGRAAATRALICSYQGDVPGIIRHAHQALKYLPEEDLTWRSVTALTLGNAHGFKGDMTAAYEARSEALRACQAAGDTYFVMLASLELAITSREQGRLRRTIEICRQQQRVAVEFGLSQTRIVGWLLAVWGEALAEINDLNEALDRAKKGFKLTERSGDLQMFGWSFMCLMRILISRGDLAGAEATIRKMTSVARQSQLPPWITNQVTAWQARLWLVQDKLEAAFQWAEGRGLDTGGEPMRLREIDFFVLFDYLVLARLLIAQGRLDESGRLLQHLLKVAEAGGRTSKAIEIKMLQALTFQGRGEKDRALASLEKALSLAKPEGFIRVFVDEGRPMTRLLNEALNGGIAPEYVRRLLAAFSSDESMPADATTSLADQSALVEPLSERELEVLQLIAAGLTNREIADRLYLSPNTVKVHSRNIYGKLDAHSRTQAVAKARDLGILPPT